VQGGSAEAEAIYVGVLLGGGLSKRTDSTRVLLSQPVIREIPGPNDTHRFFYVYIWFTRGFSFVPKKAGSPTPRLRRIIKKMKVRTLSTSKSRGRSRVEIAYSRRGLKVRNFFPFADIHEKGGRGLYVG